jgi:hypothetical protein
MTMHPIMAGILGGLLAGIVFGGMMQIMSAPTPDGGSVPMLQMVAQVVGSTSIAIGWLYHLFNSAIIGAIFSWLFGSRAVTVERAVAWGAVYGVGWWVLGGLVLMPVMLGMAPFAPVMIAPMRPVALGSLVGHLVYGLILGGVFPILSRSGRPAVA